MRFYVDTSVVVSLFLPEPGTAAAQQWLSENASRSAISDWTKTEAVAVFALNARTGRLDAGRYAASCRAFLVLVESLDVCALRRSHFETAMSFLQRMDIGLKAPDALHVAVCAERGETLVTFDKAMSRAAIVLGVPTLSP